MGLPYLPPLPVEVRRPVVGATRYDRTTYLGESHAFGLTPRVLLRAGFKQPFRGVYVAPELDYTAELQYDAAQLTIGRIALASHLTAAQLHDLPVPHGTVPHFWLPEGEKGRSTAGMRPHWFKVGEVPAYRMVAGRRATSIGKTFIDLATILRLIDLVAFGDAAIKRPSASVEQLRDLAAERGRRHIRRARQAVELIRPRVDSPPETHLRLLMVFAGLPEPETGLAVYDASGEWIATPDLSYPSVKLAIEYDGRHHAESTKQWTRDVDRNALLVDNGWKVIVVLSDHLYKRPHLLLDRLLASLRERGHPSAPGALDMDWRPYFH